MEAKLVKTLQMGQAPPPPGGLKYDCVPTDLKCPLSDQQTLKQVNHPKPKAETADQLHLCAWTVFLADGSGFSCDTDTVCIHLITHFTLAAIGKFGKAVEEYFRCCFLPFL